MSGMEQSLRRVIFTCGGTAGTSTLPSRWHS